MSNFDVRRLYSTSVRTTKTIKGFDSEGNEIEFDVEVRRLPHSDVAAFLVDRASEDKKTRIEAAPRVLARAIRFDGGEVSAKSEDFMKMDVTTVGALIDAFLEVNKAKRDDELGNG